VVHWVVIEDVRNTVVIVVVINFVRDAVAVVVVVAILSLIV